MRVKVDHLNSNCGDVEDCIETRKLNQSITEDPSYSSPEVLRDKLGLLNDDQGSKLTEARFQFTTFILSAVLLTIVGGMFGTYILNLLSGASSFNLELTLTFIAIIMAIVYYTYHRTVPKGKMTASADAVFIYDKEASHTIGTGFIGVRNANTISARVSNYARISPLHRDMEKGLEMKLFSEYPRMIASLRTIVEFLILYWWYNMGIVNFFDYYVDRATYPVNLPTELSDNPIIKQIRKRTDYSSSKPKDYIEKTANPSSPIKNTISYRQPLELPYASGSDLSGEMTIETRGLNLKIVYDVVSGDGPVTIGGCNDEYKLANMVPVRHRKDIYEVIHRSRSFSLRLKFYGRLQIHPKATSRGINTLRSLTRIRKSFMEFFDEDLILRKIEEMYGVCVAEEVL